MSQQKHTIEAIFNTDVFTKEDGGQYLEYAVNNTPESDNGVFVKFCSWDENKEHEEFKKFENRKVRITVETLD